MRVSTFLPLATLSTAFVIPDDSAMSQFAIESDNSPKAKAVFEDLKAKVPSKDDVVDFVEDSFSSTADQLWGSLDDAIEWASDESEEVATALEDEYFDMKGWFETAQAEFEEGGFDDDHHHDGPPPPPHHGPPHHGPPHHGPPHHGPPPPHHGPHHGPPHHGPPRNRSHCPHKHKPNMTVYEIISKSKYTTKLAALINADPDLVSLLNGTEANFTVFAPTDKAFEKIPKHGKEPPKEVIDKVLAYHISPEFYPAGRVLVTKTIPTLLEGKYLSPEPKDTPQRLSTNIGLRGLTVNYYSRIVAINIFGTNGVIHGISSILIPPPKATKVLGFLPAEFSTLELGLVKTGLYPAINDTSTHFGGTLFAPSNLAFVLLGPRVSGFLFSEFGLKYLKALLSYHVVANQTLYSDAFYKVTGSESESDSENEGKDAKGEKIPRGKFHTDLPTLLRGHSLSIDIARFGRLIDIRINGFQSVSVPDGVVKDGVIHVVNRVIIPPKTAANGEVKMYEGEELTVEDLKERLEPFVERDEDGSSLEL